MLITSGTGSAPTVAGEQHVVMSFVRRTGASNATWVVFCGEATGKAARCEEVVSTFALLDPL